MGVIRLSELLELPEREYRIWAGLIERDPFYRLLAHPPEGLPRIVRRKPWPQSRFAPVRWEAGSATAPAEAMEIPDAILAAIRKMGREAFERHFLYEEGGTGIEAAARVAGISLEQARAVEAYLDAAQMAPEAGPAAASAPSAASDETVAVIERSRDGLSLAFLTPHYARGRYEIDYDRLKPLKASGLVPRKDWARVRELLGRLERANAKQTVLAGLLQLALKEQSAYLSSGDPAQLKPLAQKQAASRLAAATSTVSRALAGRAVRLPWGETRPLASLFPSTRRVAVEFVRASLAREPDLADRELQKRLDRDRRIRVSARSVNGYRRERA